MKKKILFVVSSAKQIGPKKRPTGNFLTETAHPYVTFRRQGYDVGCNIELERDKPRAGFVANTVVLIRSGAVGFIN
jgi:hypothetical protein